MCLYLCCCCCFCEGLLRNIRNYVMQALTKLISKLKALKDQIMFVVFSLGMYIFDIGTDVWQAIDYLR